MNIERRRKTEKKTLKMGDFKRSGQNRCHENLQTKVWAVIWCRSIEEKSVSHILLKASDIGLQMYNSCSLAETDERKTAIVWKKFEEYCKSQKHFRLAQLRLHTMRQKEAETVDHSMSSSSAEMQISRHQRDRRAHNWTTDSGNCQWRCEMGVARQGRQRRKTHPLWSCENCQCHEVAIHHVCKNVQSEQGRFWVTKFTSLPQKHRGPKKSLQGVAQDEEESSDGEHFDLVLTCLMMTTPPWRLLLF